MNANDLAAVLVLEHGEGSAPAWKKHRMDPLHPGLRTAAAKPPERPLPPELRPAAATGRPA